MARVLRFVFLALAVFLVSTAALAQPVPAATPHVAMVSIHPVRSADGAAMYQAYCSSCHGTGGRGDGPAAKGLVQPVPDLTSIANRDGRYDQVHVRLHISDASMHAGMPDWQSALSSIYSDHRTHLALYNLERYVSTLQASR